MDESKRPSRLTALERFLIELQQERAKSLFAEISTRQPEEFARLGYVEQAIIRCISMLILSMNLCVFSLGVWLLYNFWFSPMLDLVAAILILGSCAARPKFGSMPSSSVNSEQYPHIFKFVEGIARAQKSKVPDSIVINNEFNASMGFYGLTRKRKLTLGLPLLEVLTIEEKAALVAHELAHVENGDVLRGQYSGLAIATVFSWATILKPQSPWYSMDDTNNFFVNLLAVPFKILVFLLSILLEGLGKILITSTWKESQRAEYLADYCAAQTAGTAASIGALLKSAQFGKLTDVMSKLEYSPDWHSEDPIRDLKYAFEPSPGEPDAIFAMDDFSKTSTHPPVQFRMEFLRLNSRSGTNVYAAEDTKEIENELLTLRPAVIEKLFYSYFPRRF